MEWDFPTLVRFSTISNISISIKRYNFTLVYFKVACNANLKVERNSPGLSFYISIRIFLKFWNTSSNNIVSLWTYRSWYYPQFLILKFLQNFMQASVFASASVRYSIFKWQTRTKTFLKEENKLIVVMVRKNI